MATRSKPTVIFYGTSTICLPFLEKLEAEFHLPLIITQPDSVGGRNRQAIIPAVKSFALAHGIGCLQPQSLHQPEVAEAIREARPEIGVVIAYGQLIPKSLFLLPRFHTVNVHFSLLPAYRGAAPVQRALEHNESISGITIFEICRKLDAGPIWAQKTIDILPEDNTPSLWDRMSVEGSAFLNQTLHQILAETITQRAQNHDLATFAPPIQKEEGHVQWDLTATQLVNKFRAFTPWPGLQCQIKCRWFKLTGIRASSLSHQQHPGDVLYMDKNSLGVCCGQGTVLEILEFQPEGKKPMSPYCYCRGNELPDCLC